MLLLTVLRNSLGKERKKKSRKKESIIVRDEYIDAPSSLFYSGNGVVVATYRYKTKVFGKSWSSASPQGHTLLE